MSEWFTKYTAVKIEPNNTCESICCYKDMVLIGTKQGFILFFRVSYEEKNINNKNYVTSEFLFLLRDFTKKSIVQIQIIEEFGFILSLADGNIFVHRINDYKLIHTIENKKATKFTADVYIKADLLSSNVKKKNLNLSKTADDSQIARSILNDSIEKEEPQLRICLTTKKKLVIINWSVSEKKFIDSENDIKLLETVKSTQFFFNYLCYGTKTEYIMLNLVDGESKIFTVGRCQEPFFMRVADMMAIKIDEVLELLDKDCNLLSNGTLRWSFIPTALLYHPPLAMAVVDKIVEVRMITPTLLIQSVAFDNASLITRYMDRVYVLSDKVLYVLKSRPRHFLVQKYSENKDFEVALMCAKTAPLVGESFIDSTKINIKYSINLFKNRQFEKAFNIFMEMLIDPSNVLNLFPSLCPKAIIKNNKHVSISEDFNEEETKEAIHSLIEYLVKWRYKLRHCKEDNVECKAMFDGNNICSVKSNLEQIVDTSLLKCYLIINSPLIMSLLKQKNSCHLEEAKKYLMENEKYQELVLLYESHERHEDALNILYSQSAKSHSALGGIHPTLRYMKNLNPDYINLIYEYGDWILAKNPMEWLNIFTYWDHRERTELDDDVKKFPSYKENVLKHLKVKSPDMVIPFLERIIYDNKTYEDFEMDTDTIDSDQDLFASFSSCQPKFELLPFDDTEPLPIIDNLTNESILHTSYVVALIKKVLSLRPPQLLNVDIKGELQNPAPDSKYVYQLRIRLKRFLESDKAKYNTEPVLTEFTYDAFYEERALVLAKADKDEQALTLWIYVLNNWPLALSHCNNSYKNKKNIFFKLLNICVDPSDPATMGIVVPSLGSSADFNSKISTYNGRFNPKLDKALEILKTYGDKLNILPTIKLLSSSFKIHDLLPFIKNSLRKQSTTLNQAVYLRNVQFSKKYQSNLKLAGLSKKYFVMDQDSKCSVCKKSMGPSALVRYPDGSLSHYGCCKSLLQKN